MQRRQLWDKCSKPLIFISEEFAAITRAWAAAAAPIKGHDDGVDVFAPVSVCLFGSQQLFAKFNDILKVIWSRWLKSYFYWNTRRTMFTIFIEHSDELVWNDWNNETLEENNKKQNHTFYVSLELMWRVNTRLACIYGIMTTDTRRKLHLFCLEKLRSVLF